MPITPTYPGVYVQEAPSNNHNIIPVTTADTAFVDVFERGPANVPTRISTFGEFTGTFGALNRKSKSSYGIYQFFQNGGGTAWVVRVPGAKSADATGKTKDVSLVACGPGEWGNNLQAASQPSSQAKGLFDLVVRELTTPTAAAPQPQVAQSEVYLGLSTDPDHPQFVTTVLEQQSGLVRVSATPASVTPGAPGTGTKTENKKSIVNPANVGNPNFAAFTQGVFKGGKNDYSIAGPDTLGAQGDPENDIAPTGLYTLSTIAPNVFNLLCLPAMAAFTASEWVEMYSRAISYCNDQRAFLIADPPDAAVYTGSSLGTQMKDMETWFDGLSGKSDLSAVYFPRIKIPDPASNGMPMVTEVSGTIAGQYAKSDTAYGVWKAPAGNTTSMSSVLEATAKIDKTDDGQLNPLGINAIRPFPVIGTCIWGTRTMLGADIEQSQWKYINVRRFALFLEQSLLQSTTWAVFEGNDEKLWSSLRLSIGAFMDGLYKKGAFGGASAKDSYFVACDATTTTPLDQQNGRVNVNVGFAPLYPAEFVVITISQIMSQ